MNSWQIFQGNRTPHSDVNHLPPPPSWRSFSDEGSDPSDPSSQESMPPVQSQSQKRGSTFQAREEEIDVVNAALYLRRPLLVTGRPGTGKTSLAYAVAYELGLGEVLYWPVTTRTTLKDGLYSYDAIGRLQDSQQKGEDGKLEDIGQYIQLGPLGTALLPSDQPRMLLIDEIDKSDIDLPNDLLHMLEEGRFQIPELVRIAKKVETVEVRTSYTDELESTYSDSMMAITAGRVRCRAFPFVVLTSNGERDFPPAFLRRCLRLSMKEPDEDELARIVASHLGQDVADQSRKLIEDFKSRRDRGDLATDQLLNAIYLMTRERGPVGADKEKLIEQLWKYLSSTED
ncbi:MAG: MoxR family ATPase [Cyanobacteria bacterium P01_E01_bin.6]